MFLLRTEKLPPELVRASSLRDLARGEPLYFQGDPAEAVFVLLYGRLQLCTTTSEGRQVPLYVVRAGECVSEAAVFAERYCSDVIAETKSRVRGFEKKTLQNTFLRYPLLAQEFMTLQAIRCNTLRVSLELRSLRSARDRILQFLNIAVPSSGIRIDRPLRNIADDLGLTHESFYRTLNQLISEGVIRRTAKTIRLNVAGQIRGPAKKSL